MEKGGLHSIIHKPKDYHSLSPHGLIKISNIHIPKTYTKPKLYAIGQNYK